MIEDIEDIETIRETLERKGYVLASVLGVGGFAQVFKVSSFKYSQHFAAKVFNIGTPQLSKNIPSFTAEVNALSSIYHQNVINIYTHFTDKTHLYIILEYCPGGSLMDVAKVAQKMDSDLVFDWFHQCLDALAACHRKGITHRDIKPSNILLDIHNRAKLADFGLSLTTEKTRFISSRFGGSKPYCPPEMIRGDKFDPFKSDIWSLGMTFFGVICGRLPFKANTDEELSEQILTANIEIPQNIDTRMKTILDLMLVKDPALRPSCDELLGNKVFECYCSMRCLPKLQKAFCPSRISSQIIQCSTSSLSRRLMKKPFHVIECNHTSLIANPKNQHVSSVF